jgi:hypothetical protein
MTRFDFDVISDAPPPRAIKPADAPPAEPPAPHKGLPHAQEPLPQSDAA